MSSINQIDILAVGVHPDDVELSCSGTILKSIAEGKKVALLDLTEGELGSRGTVQTRYQEAKHSGDILGIVDRVNINIGDGTFENNHENRLKVIEQIRFFKPSVVLINAPDDRHPDHGRAAKLVADACFYSGLVRIETNLNGNEQEEHRPKSVYYYIQDRYIAPDFVVDVSDFVDKKMESIQAYSTQFYNPDVDNGPATPISGKDFLDFLLARMREMGRPAGYKYAEGFVSQRTIGVKSLFDLD
ncbi:MAG: bacillithiol biosynthesis deacetylase BshB1 [Lentimonas sp.]|jgi:bacillithiol biosynthesis deacetylase BshB1